MFLSWFGCCWKDFCWQFVIMRNHDNREVVNLLEQLTELSKAKVMPGIRPQIKMQSSNKMEEKEV